MAVRMSGLGSIWIDGLRWYNNDGTSPFEAILLASGESGGPELDGARIVCAWDRLRSARRGGRGWHRIH